MKFQCAHCGKTAERPAGSVNRSRAAGMSLFCGRRCFGLDKTRRLRKSKAQCVEAKRLYDAEYRRKNLAEIKAKKAAHFKRTYDPAKARIDRKKTMRRHVEYCRRPEYKQWKREYDRHLRASEYGSFAEAYMLVLDLNREIKERMTSYEIKRQNGTFGNAQARRRTSAQERTRHRNWAS